MALCRAYPDLGGTGAPEAAPEDDVNEFRAYNRMRVWRARAEIREQCLRPTWPITCWVCEPIDHLWAHLQWADEQGKLLARLVGEQSPILDCQRAFASRLQAAVSEGPLRSLLWRYSLRDGLGTLRRRLRDMTLTMSAQLDWRFRHLQTWPFKLVQMVDPLCPSTRAIAQAFLG